MPHEGADLDLALRAPAQAAYREAHEAFLSGEVAEMSSRPYGEGPRLGR